MVTPKTLHCPRCDKDVLPNLERRANNFVAECPECRRFIKNVPHTFLSINKEPSMFHFGKYKGISVNECTDKMYLQWCIENVKMTSTMERDVKIRINEL